MKVEVEKKRSADMPLIRTRQALADIEHKYRKGERGWGKMDLRSYYLQPYHQEIIDYLATTTGTGKAEVVRDMIDEWCEAQLKRKDLP